MAMDVFAANDLASFSVISGTPTESNSAGGFDPTYVTKYINTFVSAVGVIQSPQFINPTTGATLSLTDVWFHGELLPGNASGNTFEMQFLDSAGTPVVRLAHTANGVIRPDYWNGTAWVTTAATINIGTGRTVIDVHLVCGVSGSINVYANNTLVSTITGLNAAVDNAAFIQLSNAPTTAGWSQILVCDSNTIGCHVASVTPTANGANTAWVADFNAIVKLGFNDNTMISSATLGDKESYVASDITVNPGFTVNSVWFAVRARLNSVSPANILPLLRIGGVDYSGAYHFAGLNTTTFGPSIAAFATDPSGGAWNGSTNINAAEVGFQTAA